MSSRLRRLLEWCGYAQEASGTPVRTIGARLSDVVPTQAERKATAALQAETALMVSTEPYGLSVMEQVQRDWIPWPGLAEAVRRARAQGATEEDLAYGSGSVAQFRELARIREEGPTPILDEFTTAAGADPR